MQIRTNSGIPNGAERAAKRIAASDRKKPKYRKKAKYRVGQALTPLLTNALRSGKCAGILTGNRPRTGVPHVVRPQSPTKPKIHRQTMPAAPHKAPVPDPLAPFVRNFGIGQKSGYRSGKGGRRIRFVSADDCREYGDRKNRRSEKARRHRYRDRRTISFASARNGTGRPSGPECRLWWRAATRARPDRISCR